MTPLRNLLSAYDNEANLSLVGRLAARWDTLRSLGNLLRFDQSAGILNLQGTLNG